MKLKNKLLLPVFFVTCLGTSAHAISDGGLFVEPMITYEDGDTETNFPAPFSNSTGESKGWGLGARLGVHFMESFFFGVDGRYSITDFKDSSLNYNEKATQANLGPVIGVQMPVFGLRVWGSYIAAGELNPDASGSTDVKYSDGRGSRVGVGIHLAAISLNAEYQQVKYDKTTVEDGGGIFAPGSTFDDVELENKSWLFSVSFPLEL